MPDFKISTFRIKISAPHLLRLPRLPLLPRLPPSPAYSRVTFVVICVVSTLSRPSKSCSVRVSVPLSSKCVANECRSTCGVGREPAHFSPATTAGCLDKKRGGGRPRGPRRRVQRLRMREQPRLVAFDLASSGLAAWLGGLGNAASSDEARPTTGHRRERNAAIMSIRAAW